MSTEKPPATAPVDAVVMRQIEHWLATWDEPGNEARMRFESAREYWDRALQPMEDAILVSTRITEADLQTVIV